MKENATQHTTSHGTVYDSIPTKSSRAATDVETTSNGSKDSPNGAEISNPADIRITPVEALPTVLNATQLAAVLGISRAGAYNLLNSRDFPTLHIGARKLVATGKLMEWIDRHSNGGAAV